MQIQTSLDWLVVGTDLADQLHKVPYNRDLVRMFNNIGTMVDELSKQEVETRRINKPEYNKQKVDDINKAIDHLEKLLLLAKLMS
jgi:hypothetical protein